jgi:hypothetical protein
MTHTKRVILPIISLLFATVLVVALPHSSHAMVYTLQSGIDASQGQGQPTELFGNDGIFTTITNILLFLIGTLSVIMIIVGGLRYVVSGGNNTAVTGAKNTILYAIIGLVIAFLAYAVVNFVLGSLASGGVSGGTNV